MRAELALKQREIDEAIQKLIQAKEDARQRDEDELRQALKEYGPSFTRTGLPVGPVYPFSLLIYASRVAAPTRFSMPSTAQIRAVGDRTSAAPALLDPSQIFKQAQAVAVPPPPMITTTKYPVCCALHCCATHVRSRPPRSIARRSHRHVLHRVRCPVLSRGRISVRVRAPCARGHHSVRQPHRAARRTATSSPPRLSLRLVCLLLALWCIYSLRCSPHGLYRNPHAKGLHQGPTCYPPPAVRAPSPSPAPALPSPPFFFKFFFGDPFGLPWALHGSAASPFQTCSHSPPPPSPLRSHLSRCCRLLCGSASVLRWPACTHPYASSTQPTTPSKAPAPPPLPRPPRAVCLVTSPRPLPPSPPLHSLPLVCTLLPSHGDISLHCCLSCHVPPVRCFFCRQLPYWTPPPLPALFPLASSHGVHGDRLRPAGIARCNDRHAVPTQRAALHGL